MVKQNFYKSIIEIARNKPDTLVTDIIDFYLTENKTEVGILKSIASQLDEKKFSEFLEYLKDNVSLPQVSTIARKKFLKSLKALTEENKQIALIFDTVELVNDAISRFFTKLLQQLKEASPNLVVVISGRSLSSEKNFFTHLPFLSSTIHAINLKGLELIEIEKYFSNKTILNYLEKATSPTFEQIQSISKLSQGKPILIALIIDWLKEGSSISDLLSFETVETFEKAMVERVANLTNPEDQLIWAMAHLYRRFDDKILSYIFPEFKALTQDLINSLARFSFVKVRYSEQGGIISCLLHDEMRELVKEYILKKEDRFHSVRTGWSQKVVKYYGNLIVKADDDLEKQHLSCEQLFYQLDANIEQGIECWRELRDKEKAATWEYRESIHTEIQHYRNDLPVKIQSELDVYAAFTMYEQRSYQKAIDLLETVLKHNNCSIELI